MTSPEKLLELYAEAFREGKSDPRPFLERAAREDRDELSALIEMFLVRTEPAEWDPEVFEGSLAERVTNRILPEIVVPERPAKVSPVTGLAPVIDEPEVSQQVLEAG